VRARTLAALFVAICLLGACSGRQKRPTGPPPEYERPEVMPWDSGRPVDPFENVQGEEVTDDEPTGDDAGAAPADAATPDSSGDAALSLDSGLG
jgi:hypothetical protein